MRDKKGNPTIILLAVAAIAGLLYIGFFNHEESQDEGDEVSYAEPSSSTPAESDGQIVSPASSSQRPDLQFSEDDSPSDVLDENSLGEESGTDEISTSTSSISTNSADSNTNHDNQNQGQTTDTRGPNHSEIPLDNYTVHNDDSQDSDLSIWELAKHDGYPDASVYGINYYVPAGFVYLEPENPPPIGRNYLLYNPNLDMTIYIWEAFEHQFPDGVYLDNVIEDTYAEASLNDSVTYKRKGDHWCVVSGTEDNGKTIFYNKTIIVEFDYEDEWDRDGLEGWCNITYPSANQDLCSSVVEQFENSFRPSNYSA